LRLKVYVQRQAGCVSDAKNVTCQVAGEKEWNAVVRNMDKGIISTTEGMKVKTLNSFKHFKLNDIEQIILDIDCVVMSEAFADKTVEGKLKEHEIDYELGYSVGERLWYVNLQTFKEGFNVCEEYYEVIAEACVIVKLSYLIIGR